MLIFALVDANADILCTYRFGSTNRVYDNLLLTLPDLIWIGGFYSAIDLIQIGVFYSHIQKQDLVYLLQKLIRLRDKARIKSVVKQRAKLMGMIEV